MLIFLWDASYHGTLEFTQEVLIMSSSFTKYLQKQGACLVQPLANCPWLWESPAVSWLMSACGSVALELCSCSIPIQSQGPNSHPTLAGTTAKPNTSSEFVVSCVPHKLSLLTTSGLLPALVNCLLGKQNKECKVRPGASFRKQV